MNADVKYILSMSCVLPALVGIYRFNKIHKKFRPFIYMMLLDTVIETIYYLASKFALVSNFSKMAVNIYILFSFALFLYLVYINGYLTKKVKQALLIAAFIIAAINYFYLGTMFKTFTVLFCFIWSLSLIISIDILSRQIMALNEKLLNNFWFWVSSAYILYNAFNLLVYGPVFFLNPDPRNGEAIGNIQHFANAASYIFFAIAIFRIPEKRLASSL